MSESALDRVARALNLIPFISKNPGLSVLQIAERFNSTPTQISKDLTLLHMCGLPGYSHLELLDIDYEDPDYISVTEAQVLDQPRSLTQVEATTLVLGLQLLGELSTNSDELSAITALRERIAGALGAQLNSQVTIADAIEETPMQSSIKGAILENRALTFTYNSASSDSVTSRKVFPVSLDFREGIAYLQARLIPSGEVRTFRVDRILELVLGDIGANHLLTPESNVEAPENREIEIELGRDGLFFVEKHNEIVTSFSEVGERHRISLEASGGEWLVRTLLAWPEPVTVIKPLDLAALLKERIAGAIANYQ